MEPHDERGYMMRLSAVMTATVAIVVLVLNLGLPSLIETAVAGVIAFGVFFTHDRLEKRAAREEDDKPKS